VFKELPPHVCLVILNSVLEAFGQVFSGSQRSYGSLEKNIWFLTDI